MFHKCNGINSKNKTKRSGIEESLDFCQLSVDLFFTKLIYYYHIKLKIQKNHFPVVCLYAFLCIFFVCSPGSSAVYSTIDGLSTHFALTSQPDHPPHLTRHQEKRTF